MAGQVPGVSPTTVERKAGLEGCTAATFLGPASLTLPSLPPCLSGTTSTLPLVFNPCRASSPTGHWRPLDLGAGGKTQGWGSLGTVRP